MRTLFAFLTDPLVHILLIAACLVVLTGYRANESQSLAYSPPNAKVRAASGARHEAVSWAELSKSRMNKHEASR